MQHADSSHLVTMRLELPLNCCFPALTAPGGASRGGILAPRTVCHVRREWPPTCIFAGNSPADSPGISRRPGAGSRT